MKQNETNDTQAIHTQTMAHSNKEHFRKEIMEIFRNELMSDDIPHKSHKTKKLIHQFCDQRMGEWIKDGGIYWIFIE